jgi:subtilisin family serine protease
VSPLSLTRPFLRFAAATVCAVALMTAAAAAPPAGAQTPAKQTVTSAADLPVFTYPIALAPSKLIDADAATFNAFASPVRANIETVLAGYDIQDHATLRGLLEQKLELQLLSGTEDAAALATADQIRALEDKPDAKLLSGVQTRAVVAARAKSGAASGPAYLAAFREAYASALAPLPWSAVGTLLKETKTYYDVVTPAMMIGQTAGIYDGGAAKSRTVSSDTAAQIIRARFLVNVTMMQGAAGSAVIAALIAQHTVQKPDIWAARDVTLHAGDHLTPVRIAVWDSGSDVSLFPHQLYTDPSPKHFDAHGLAFDIDARKTHGVLLPLTPQQRAEYPSMATFLEGFSDLQQSIDSPAAASVKKQLAALKPADVPTFFEKLSFYAIYGHGTHVTGIALRGNPAARLVVGRITFDYKLVPTPPTEELTRRDASNYQTYVDYYRSHSVRVVNMSWGGTPAALAQALEKNNIGKDAAERKTMAERLFAIDRAGLYNAIKSAPDILFVCAAGNGDSDSGFNEFMPASFNLPNLLVAGAVDQAGDETSFTSYGKTVRVDADGFHVESTVPGGMRIRISGTSMASPNVANLAAKLIALDPRLTPLQTIALIREGATATRDGRRHNIDPKRSVQLLRQMKEAARTASGSFVSGLRKRG